MESGSPGHRIEVTLSVASHEDAEELRAAWQEIVTRRKLPRAQALEQDSAAIIDRAQEALARIEKAIYDHPTTGQARRLVQFLAAIYNGHDYDFDLTDLRILDTELASACLDYLNYDRYVAPVKMFPTVESMSINASTSGQSLGFSCSA